ncbi:right-handed parallel beta-helix repeat-containing protein [Streptomyces sp. NPDC046324]|uniref:right-handed parallel beta-helix repeat-containing protein n=1 Tax=Streptomyces sp. NPDC046324 TaxID=3154915 RepID=UPI00340D3971
MAGGLRHPRRTSTGGPPPGPRLAQVWSGARPVASVAPFRGVGAARCSIRDNEVIDVGGDGIVLQHGHHALVEHNYVDGFNLRSAGYNVGVWAWDLDDAVYQYNEVTGGHGTLDSQAFDFDGGNNRNVYQYNYSHDNEGGFLLVCNATGMTSADNVFRSNVSIGDRNTWSPPYGVISVVCPAATTNSQVYNNTVVTDRTGTAMVSDNGKGGVTFRNNIFVSTTEGGSPIVDALNTYDHNLYVGVGAVPAGDAHAVTADPRFLDATPDSPSDLRLRPGSPALGAGTPIENPGRHDYFGNRLSARPTSAPTSAPVRGSASGEDRAPLGIEGCPSVSAPRQPPWPPPGHGGGVRAPPARPLPRRCAPCGPGGGR